MSMSGLPKNGSNGRSADGAAVERLWELFSHSRSQEVRDKLIIHYAWLVKYVMSRLSIVLPPSLDYGDLLGHGTIALVEAVDRFEPERGNKFETYASVKIRGAILDAIRSMDFVSRPARRRMKMVAETVNRLTRQLNRPPTDEEMAAELGVSVEALHRIYQRGAATIVSLDSMPLLDASEDDVALHEAFADDGQLDPVEEAVKSETVESLAQVIDNLSEREQLVLSLYYQDGLNMREIGEVLGVSESRVCQIHSKCIVYLRAQLGELNPDLEDEVLGITSRVLVGA